MRVGIIGTGNAALSLGCQWEALGHEVWFGLDQLDTQAAQRVENVIPQAEIGDIDDVAGADIVVVAVPGDRALEVTASLGDLEGRVVLDCSWGPDDGALGELSRAEAMQMLMCNARIVRVFPQGGWANAHRAPLFLCGDEPDSVRDAAELLRGVTQQVLAIGPLGRARNMECCFGWFQGRWSDPIGLA